MLRSMYSGITGMKNMQTKLDVIGNNIANVSTYGFKKGRVTFKNEISQLVAGASAPNGNMGGTNAKQVGLGSSISSIDTIHEPGSMQTTGRTLDLAISGDGYFVLSKDGGATKYFSRAGNFYLDDDGTLVNSEGYKVLGTNNAPITITGVESFSISPDGSIVGVVNATPTNKGTIQVVSFNNSGGLESVGGNLYQQTGNSGAPIAATGTSVVSGKLEMSNVDLSEEFTEMIVAQRGFQANTRIITTSDEILQELVNLKR
ncbi:flagellar basal body rod protein FlgG [Bacillus andreraoultii]|uniref:flagellar basal body rod protein FlgG n=1 Tax=Bacillus andreraoultii TaxID=1499685 RepID=UPI00053B50EE|nr:flagellar basal body rod protein FlgG [Bacillus andreraoultii]